MPSILAAASVLPPRATVRKYRRSFQSNTAGLSILAGALVQTWSCPNAKPRRSLVLAVAGQRRRWSAEAATRVDRILHKGGPKSRCPPRHRDSGDNNGPSTPPVSAAYSRCCCAPGPPKHREGAGLAEQTRAHDRTLRARRQYRHRGAAAGSIAPGATGPALRHRESPRRRHQYRN